MKLPIILLFTCMVLQAQSQKKIVTISFQEFYKNKQNSLEDSTNTTFFQKSFGNTLPYFQYIHFINNELGFGIQFSYQRTRYHNIRKFATPTPNYYGYDESTNKQDGFTLGLSIHEKMKLNKYIILNAIKIPFEYYTKSQQQSNRYNYYASSPLVQYSMFKSKIIGRPAFITGIYYQLSIHRKIYNKFHASAGFNAGFDYLRYFGSTIKTDIDFTNNITYVAQYKTFKTYQINVLLKPSFGLSYFF